MQSSIFIHQLCQLYLMHRICGICFDHVWNAPVAELAAEGLGPDTHCCQTQREDHASMFKNCKVREANAIESKSQCCSFIKARSGNTSWPNTAQHMTPWLINQWRFGNCKKRANDVPSSTTMSGKQRSCLFWNDWVLLLSTTTATTKYYYKMLVQSPTIKYY